MNIHNLVQGFEFGFHASLVPLLRSAGRVGS